MRSSRAVGFGIQGLSFRERGEGLGALGKRSRAQKVKNKRSPASPHLEHTT